MIHHATTLQEGHYSVGGNETCILLQVQNEHGEQARVRLTQEETHHLIELLWDQLVSRVNAPKARRSNNEEMPRQEDTDIGSDGDTGL